VARLQALGVSCEAVSSDSAASEPYQCIANAIGRKPPATTSSVGQHKALGCHAGDWRDAPHRQRFCSLPHDRDGSVCLHSGGLIVPAHWSCCGAIKLDAPCTVRQHFVFRPAPSFFIFSTLFFRR